MRLTYQTIPRLYLNSYQKFALTNLTFVANSRIILSRYLVQVCESSTLGRHNVELHGPVASANSGRGTRAIIWFDHSPQRAHCCPFTTPHRWKRVRSRH